jgi:hypothetical protein
MPNPLKDDTMLPHVAIVIAVALGASGIGVAVRSRRASRTDASSGSGDLAARCHELVADHPAPHGIAGVIAVVAAGALFVLVRAPRVRMVRRRF